MASKDSLFAQLKPPAIALSEAVLTLSTSRKDVRTVEIQLVRLREIVSVAANDSRFDVRLADYVFFPVAQILKHSQQVSVRSLELSLAIVTILIARGWRDRIEKNLAQQILILCTLLASHDPPALSINETSTELQSHAFDALTALFTVAGSWRILTVDDANIPQLGQTLSTVLTGLWASTDPDVQKSAVKALDAFVHAQWPEYLLWTFLPGIVSTVAKVLKPRSNQRRSADVLISGLHILRHLLKLTFSDDHATEPLQGHEENATQVRVAVGSFSKLIEHDKQAVRDALCQLHLMILENCSKTLQNCVDLAIDTVVTVADKSSSFKLSMLASCNQPVRSALQSALYDWSTSLVRIMQSSDEDKKIKRIEQIRSSYSILAEANIDQTTIGQHLERCLTDGLVALMHEGDTRSSTVAVQTNALDMMAVSSFATVSRQAVFKQTRVIDRMQHLLQTVCSQDDGQAFVETQNRALLHATGDSQIAAFWLALSLIENRVDRHNEADDFLDCKDTSIELHGPLAITLDTAYALSLQVLSSDSEQAKDPRLISLALRCLALRAKVSGQDFRFELIDALYPVLDVLATPNELLRQDAMAALNDITTACGYRSVTDLIIDNVDYLTNAVALKLNSFDMSPQGPQILIMMVQLAGPGLLPYLEDSVESIFAALEDYNGYPLLVELLFKTLSAMAQEGCKAPALAGSRKAIQAAVSEELHQPVSVNALAGLLRDRRAEIDDTDVAMTEAEPAPQQPWSTNRQEDQEPMPTDTEQNGPPAPKVYALLLKITDLTQHFLPSASASLRLSLLTLITHTIPAIAKHEDSFLPLVNTLWPEIVARLDDDEMAIKAAAIDAIAALCEYAGSFLRGRVSDLWPRIRSLCIAVLPQTSTRLKWTAASRDHNALRLVRDQHEDSVTIAKVPELYGDTVLRRAQEALSALLVAIVQHVPISTEHFDEVMELADSSVDKRELLGSLERQNADAVWLHQLRSGAFVVGTMAA